MKLCNNWKLGVVPQGGNTSLVGTSTPIFDEVVMSTRRMNKILSIDPDTGKLAYLDLFGSKRKIMINEKSL